MSWLGLDIGGANIKVADGNGYAHSVGFPLWQKPGDLAAALEELLANSPPADSLAVTMTGELADCYETKADGVHAILGAVQQAAGKRETLVYLCDGCFVSIEEAREKPMLTAASNWVVLANFASRYCVDGPALLIDLGSTTCDIIPIVDSRPATVGSTDTERLAAGELLYTGVRRSPICAVVSEIPWRDGTCRVAHELFATMQDVYLLGGLIAEDSKNFDTADGRSCSRAAAHGRLARTICADSTMFSVDDAQRAAEYIHHKQLDLIESALRQVLLKMEAPPATIVTSGQGEFLLLQLSERLEFTCEVVSLTEMLGSEISEAACAHALAMLARERSIS